MFWRKQSDGFEWHKYVRTTIKLRRDDRRRRIEEVKHKAVEGIKDAGRAGAAAGASGLAAFLQGARSGGKASLAGLHSLAGLMAAGLSVVAYNAVGATRAGLCILRTASGHGCAWLGSALRPAARPLTRAGVQPILVLIAAVAGLSALAGLLTTGVTPESALALAVASAVLMVALLPVFVGEQRLPRGVERVVSTLADTVTKVPPRARLALGIAGLVIIAGSALWGLSLGTPRLASLPGLYGASAQLVEGRGYALSGDMLRVSDTLIRLSGIEAPDRDQRCTKPGNRRWKCGEAAQEGLARLLRSGVVKCRLRGTDEAVRALATCYLKDKDIAATLVRQGYVFSAGGLLSGYGSDEREAKAERLGIWQGEVERPADYRAKLWEAAKRAAPDECPIKGQLSSGEKRYLLPWSPNYDRVRVRAARGERWFCSEQEALAAGWKPA